MDYTVETIKIVTEDDYAVINREDFDPETMVEFGVVYTEAEAEEQADVKKKRHGSKRGE